MALAAVAERAVLAAAALEVLVAPVDVVERAVVAAHNAAHSTNPHPHRGTPRPVLAAW